MKTRAAPGPQVVREEADAREPSDESQDEERSFGCAVTASIAKHAHATTPRLAARPSMLSSRLNAFVRPTSQRIATTHRATSFAITRRAGR